MVPPRLPARRGDATETGLRIGTWRHPVFRGRPATILWYTVPASLSVQPPCGNDAAGRTAVGRAMRGRQGDFRAQPIRQAFRPGPLSQMVRPQTGAFRPDFPAGQMDPVRKLWKKSGFLWKARGGSRRRAGQPAYIFYCVESTGWKKLEWKKYGCRDIRGG